VLAQMIAGCIEDLLDTFGIKPPTAGNVQEANEMRAGLEKLDMAMVCRAFEEKTGYLYLGGNYNTTTLTQRRRYSRFMKDWHLETSDGCRPFHGTSAEQAEVVCKDQISVSFGPLGEGGYGNVKLADALPVYHSPCDDEMMIDGFYL